MVRVLLTKAFHCAIPWSVSVFLVFYTVSVAVFDTYIHTNIEEMCGYGIVL